MKRTARPRCAKPIVDLGSPIVTVDDGKLDNLRQVMGRMARATNAVMDAALEGARIPSCTRYAITPPSPRGRLQR